MLSDLWTNPNGLRTELLVYVDRRYNSVKLRECWFWEVLDRGGARLQVRLGNGVFSFGWARTEASAYRQARRMKWIIRSVLGASHAD